MFRNLFGRSDFGKVEDQTVRDLQASDLRRQRHAETVRPISAHAVGCLARVQGHRKSACDAPVITVVSIVRLFVMAPQVRACYPNMFWIGDSSYERSQSRLTYALHTKPFDSRLILLKIFGILMLVHPPTRPQLRDPAASN